MMAIFARHSIPEQILSDNGPCYSSTEFAQFSKVGMCSMLQVVHDILSPMAWWKELFRLLSP